MRIGGRVRLPVAIAAALAAAMALSAAAPSHGPGTPGTADDAVRVAQAAPDQATLVREGASLFARECVVCHGAQGEGGQGAKLAGNANLRVSSAVINQIIRGSDYMPPFGESFNDRQIAALATYVRSSFGNSFGPVQPTEVAAARQ